MKNDTIYWSLAGHDGISHIFSNNIVNVIIIINVNVNEPNIMVLWANIFAANKRKWSAKHEKKNAMHLLSLTTKNKHLIRWTCKTIKAATTRTRPKMLYAGVKLLNIIVYICKSYKEKGANKKEEKKATTKED